MPVHGGPFYIFDQTNATSDHLGQILTISAFSKFTVHFTEINHEHNELWFGLPGKTDQMPENGFDMETIISYSDKGFYQGVQNWGNQLRTKYKKSQSRRSSDNTINYVSLGTRNYFFYKKKLS